MKKSTVLSPAELKIAKLRVYYAALGSDDKFRTEFRRLQKRLLIEPGSIVNQPEPLSSAPGEVQEAIDTFCEKWSLPRRAGRFDVWQSLHAAPQALESIGLDIDVAE